MKKRNMIFALLVSVLLLVGFSNYSEAASTRATPNIQQVKLKAGESHTVRALLISSPTMRTELKVKIETANKKDESFLVEHVYSDKGSTGVSMHYARGYVHMSTFGSPTKPTLQQRSMDFILTNMSSGEVTYNIGVNTIFSNYMDANPHPDLEFNFPENWFTN